MGPPGDSDAIDIYTEGGEEEMEIEEIANEPEDSEKVNRCKKCRRLKFGHTLPFGQDKCELPRIEDNEELKKDDELKNEKRKEIRAKKTRKRKSLSDERIDPDAKKLKDDPDAELVKLEEELKRQDEVLTKTKENLKKEEKKKDILDKLEEKKKEIKDVEDKLKLEKRYNHDERGRSNHSNHYRNSDRYREDENRRVDQGRSSRQHQGRNSPRENNGWRGDERDIDIRTQRNRQDYREEGSGFRRRESFRERSGFRNRESYREGSGFRRRENYREESRPRNREGSGFNWGQRRSRSRDGYRSPPRRSPSRKSENHEVSRELNRVGEERLEDRKLDPPPVWEESISFVAWSRSVQVWSDVNVKPQRKAQLLIEMLKKEEKKKGLKEMVVSEIIENKDFNYKDPDVITNILKKIEEFMEESEWTRNVSLAKEFEKLSQKEGESNREYVVRFSNIETKLKNEKVGISNIFLAGWLLNKSRIPQAEKNNILANFDLEDKENILKNLKKKIRNLSATEVIVDPKNTLFGERRGSNGDYRYRSKSRDRFKSRERSKSRNKENRYSSHRDRSGSRNFQREKGHRNGSQSPKYVKKTYTCENLKLNKAKSIFEAEVENRALVDSGCPEMVCGIDWMKTFEHSTERKYEDLDIEDHFKFGNEVFKTSTYKKIPLQIGSLTEMVDVGVVPANIPLLISKRKLKDWGAKIDFEKNELFIRKTNETIQLNETASGHLTINVAKTLPENSEEFVQEIFLIKKAKKNNTLRLAELKKVHRVFGHPSVEKMESILRDAGEDGVVIKLMRKIQEKCRVCKKFKRKASKPKVGLPKAREVNETVSVDLKPVASLLQIEHDQRQVVYMVDEFSKYTVAGVSKNKEADEVAKVILKKWCLSGPGYPSRSFFLDNGSEFKKNNLEELSRKTGAKLQLTPAYSPRSNGTCERRHGNIDITLKKLIEDDDNLKLEEALDHAVWARNIEIGRHGKSPYQIIFGKSPFLPGISEGSILTDGIISDAEVVRKHFQNQEKARVEIRRADASRRLKDAVNARIQPYMDATYGKGDKIVFLDKNDVWNGPATVEATESKTIFALHNGNLKKVASCRARPWVEDVTEESDIDDDTDEEEIVDTLESDASVVEQTDEVTTIGSEESITAGNPLEHDEAWEVNENKDTKDNENSERRPLKGSEVVFKMRDDDAETIAKVVNVGKKKSKQQDVCWVVTDEETKAINFFRDVEYWKYLKKPKVNFQEQNDVFLVSEHSLESETMEENKKIDEKSMEVEGIFYLRREFPVEVLAALVEPKDYDHPEVKEAMNDELMKWERFGAYEIVTDDGQDTIDGRWVVNKKEAHDGLKKDYKARYCLRGFKELEKPRSDSPTVDRISSNLFYAIAANEGWNVESIDVTSAFLQGEPLDRDIFVVPPKEANIPGMLWHMKKAAYGLSDASRRWWIKVIEFLIKLGGRTLVGDECMIYFHHEGKLAGLICLHVDDFKGAGKDWFKTNIMDAIEKNFKISKRETEEFKYTGIDVARKEDGSIEIDQEMYKKSLEAIDIDPTAENSRNLNKEEFKKFRAMTGKLSWLSECTRPDLAYDCLDMSFHNRDAKIRDMKEMNKIVSKAKQYDTTLKYSKIGKFEDLKILGISDAAYLKQDEKTKSVAGRIILLSNKDETRVSPIMWKAKTIPTVCKSAKDSETRACDKTIEDSVYVARCFQEIYTGERGDAQMSVDIVTDSKPLIDSINSSKQIDNKLLRPVIKFMKQSLDSKMVNSIRWCDTKVCLADVLTKKGSNLTALLMKVLKTNEMIDLSWTDKKGKL